MRRAATILVVVAACSDAGSGGDAVRIIGATPPYGPLVGGTQVTLAGAGFADETRVFFGGREAPLAAVIDDATVDVVIPPADEPGDAEILVVNQHGNARASGVFHYTAPPEIESVAPADVVFSSTSTRVTVRGSGFRDEGAGDVSVLVDGVLASEVQVAADGELTFLAPPGRALVRPDIEIVNQRGRTIATGFRYTPSDRPGLLLFGWSGAGFALYVDPVDKSAVTIPWIGFPAVRLTAVIRDGAGEYWGVDRNAIFGRIDMRRQALADLVPTAGWFPTLVRVGDQYFGIERGSLRFGTLDPVTGAFGSIGTASLPCCGSYGLAADGSTLYLTSRSGSAVSIRTIDTTTGELGDPVSITAAPGFHVEEMRFFAGTLYAASRDGTLVSIDPATGATTVILGGIGRYNAMEIFE